MPIPVAHHGGAVGVPIHRRRARRRPGDPAGGAGAGGPKSPPPAAAGSIPSSTSTGPKPPSWKPPPTTPGFSCTPSASGTGAPTSPASETAIGSTPTTPLPSPAAGAGASYPLSTRKASISISPVCGSIPPGDTPPTATPGTTGSPPTAPLPPPGTRWPLPDPGSPAPTPRPTRSPRTRLERAPTPPHAPATAPLELVILPLQLSPLLSCQGRRQNIPVGRSKNVPPERSLASVNVRASCSGEVSQRQAGSRLGE